MSTISQELTRIQGAKSDLKTAIEAKGVTVPSATTIDGYATLVGQIQSGANLTTLNVTPSTSAQQITPSNPYDGYNEVNVAAVTSAIDANITAGNIKKDVNILGVTGNYEDYGFIYKIKAGTQTTLSYNEGMALSTLTSQNGNVGACENVFAGTKITSANLSAITSMPRFFARGMFQFSWLESIDLSELVSAPQGALSTIFCGCNRLTSVSFPKLTSMYDATNVFDGCTALVSFYAPLLNDGSYYRGNFFNNCTHLESVTIHPINTVNSNVSYNILGKATSSVFTTLRFSAMATDNVYLSWQSYLDSDSILDVLNHLSTEVSGKTCAFKNLTVASSDTNYTAISAKVSELTNWTITGLTLQ